MGFAKKMEWLKWIRKYSAGILDAKTGSMETLIDSASSKTINYAYSSSTIIGDDEFINATAAPAPQQQNQPNQQRPMLPPPPPTSRDSPSSSPPPPPLLQLQQQLPNDVYDCCVSLDGIPIKREFQYTLSDTDGYGKITQHDIEGLATKILESMYGTTLKFSSRGHRTVKVTLNVRQSKDKNAMLLQQQLQQQQQQQYRHHNGGRERKSIKTSDDRQQERYRFESELPIVCPEYGPVKDLPSSSSSSSPHHHFRSKSGAQRYRRDQLIEMVQRSLAENLSFQNLRKSNNKPEGYHRPRTKRRQSAAAEPHKTPPAKMVAWSPYDFETVARVPSPYQHHIGGDDHHYRQRLQHQIQQQYKQRMLLYARPKLVDVIGGNRQRQQQKQQQQQQQQQQKQQQQKQPQHQQHHKQQQQQQSKDVGGSPTTQEQTKNIDHQRYKRAKLASKKIHHHIHEHHHYHHYDYYIV